MLPARNDFAFDESSSRLRLNAEGLFLENAIMEPVEVQVKDLNSGQTYTLTVIGVLDEFASQGGAMANGKLEQLPNEPGILWTALPRLRRFSSMSNRELLTLRIE